MAAIIVLAILAFLLFVLAFSCIKIVRPYQRGVVERLGRYKGTVDPGLRIIVPFVDRVHLVDMREQVVEVPAQEVITSDNVSVFATGYGPTGVHKVHRNGGGADGAIVVNPTTATPHLMVFHFSTQTF